MKRLLRLLLLFPVALLGVAVDIANRQKVTVFFDPFADGEASGLQVTARLSIVLFAAVMIGVVLGGVVTWFEQGRHRSAARRARNEVRALRAELARRSEARPPEKPQGA